MASEMGRSIGQMDKKVIYIVGAVLIAGVAMFIAGCVMLGVGIHKANQKPSPSPPLHCSTSSPTTSTKETTLYASSYVPSLPWNPVFANSSSSEYGKAAQAYEKQLKATFVTEHVPAWKTISIDQMTSSPLGNGTNVFATLTWALESVNLKQVGGAFDTIGLDAFLTPNPTYQCSALLVPGGSGPPVTQSPVNPSSGAPVTGVVPTQTLTTTTPFVPPTYGTCDASKSYVNTIFLVDTATPVIGTLDSKLSQIRTYLDRYDEYLNLHGSQWSNIRFDLVTFNGDSVTAQPPCSNDSCWHSAINSLNSSNTNPNLSGYHSLTRALRYVLNNYGIARQGQGKSLVIITDGIDITENLPTVVAAELKAKNFYIGAVLVGSGQMDSNIVSSIVTDSTHFYPIPSYDWISNQAVLTVTAPWTCYAYYSTPAPPTAPSTRLPLVTTPSVATQKPTTPSVTSVPNCAVDVLFLVDESQAMLYDGYTQSLQFANALAQQIDSTKRGSRYAIITFNSQVVYKSARYLSASDFGASLRTIPQQRGLSSYPVGFNAASNFIQVNSRYTDGATRSVIIFLTTGRTTNDTSITQSASICHSIKTDLTTEIITLGLTSDLYTTTLTKEAVDNDDEDDAVPSLYINVSTSSNLLTTSTQQTVLNGIQCSGALSCSVDLYFMMETSDLEGGQNVEVEKSVINQVITSYSSQIGASKGKVSLIFFSNANNTGVLYQLQQDVPTIVQQLQSTNFVLGWESNLNNGFSLLLDVMAQDYSGNQDILVLFGRGAFDGADPSQQAAMIRSQAQIQGITMGPYSNKALMDQLTGSTSIDGNALLVKNSTTGVTNVTASADAIVNQLKPLLNNIYANPKCAAAPALSPPCQQYVDIVLILHASTSTNWQMMKRFVTSLLLPTLFSSQGRISSGTPANIAVLAYFGNDVHLLSTLDSTKTVASLSTTINNFALPASTQVTEQLSLAYKAAKTQYLSGRSLAFQMVLVITDFLDLPDMYPANIASEGLPPVLGVEIDQNIIYDIPGAMNSTTKLDSIQDLNPDNARTSNLLANQIAAALCQYGPAPGPFEPPTTPAKVTPGPIPAVRVREIWPDVAILIDVSNQTVEYFESMRQFLERTFRDQFYIANNGSRFAVATFDDTRTDIVCNFNQVNDYWDFYNCLGSTLSSSSISISNQRDINQALSTLETKLYGNYSYGFKSLNENYLYVFSLGSSTNDFSSVVSRIQKKSVRTVGVDVYKQMTPHELSLFGPQSYTITNIEDSFTRNALTNAIFAQTTTIPSPTLNSIYADFYFVVDQSSVVSDDMTNVHTFVKNFVNLLTVSYHKSRVSITSYADTLLDKLSLSDDATAVNNFINSWRTQTGGDSNIGNAIAEVDKQIGYNAQVGRSMYVIYLIGSNTTIGASALRPTQVNSLVISYNYQDNYSQQLVDRNLAQNFTLDDSSGLDNWVESHFPLSVRGRNPMNEFFLKLESLQEKSSSANIPLKEVAADILIFLDETEMSPDDFNNMKQFLSDFINQFSLSPTDTQVALQAYNGNLIPEAGFHLNDCSNNTYIDNIINNLKLEPNPSTTDADLAEALIQGINFFLIPSNGWRESAATYTIIFSNAIDFANQTDRTDLALGIKNLTKVYAVLTNGQNESFVDQFVNTKFMEIVPGPSQLKIDNQYGTSLVNAIKTAYTNQVYPQLTTYSAINADYIFFLDHTGLNSSNIQAINSFLVTFATQYANVGQSGSRLAVISYNQLGVVKNATWNLDEHSDILTLNKAIRSISVNSNGASPDLNAAIQYFLAQPTIFGLDDKRPLFVTSIFQAPILTSRIFPTTTETLNTKYFTFSIQNNQNFNEFSYSRQFLGEDFEDNFLYVDDVTKYSIADDSPFSPFNSYIQTEYMAWQNSYGTNKS